MTTNMVDNTNRRTNISINNTLSPISMSNYSRNLAVAHTIQPYTLEEHLYSFSNINPYQFLWTTWITEKQEYAKQLESVYMTFASYSSHNAEHSNVIISRIEALLGSERIALLSPTDTWLLLQCAYTHDLGMCVGEKNKSKIFDDLLNRSGSAIDLLNDEEFKKYINDIDTLYINDSEYKSDNFISSIRFIRRKIDLMDEKEKQRFINQVTRLEYSKAKNIFSSVMTNYFRKKHAEATKNEVLRQAADKTYKDLFPIRLRNLVAYIDLCHGINWVEIIKTLPQCDNGFHTDYIHPQFIAAMLRLGDLLDLDSNRFNPFIIDQIGRMPRSSAIHKLKHMAISEFMVDIRRINIRADYTTNEIKQFLERYYFENVSEKSNYNQNYKEEKIDKDTEIKSIIDNSIKTLREWITWINNDIGMVLKYWNTIIPDNMTGSIAVLGRNDIYFDNKLIEEDELDLRYRISPDRASQIIEGADLYNHPLTFIRELVQNAADTTKIQIHRYIIQSYQNQDILNIQEDIFKSVCQIQDNYKIKVTFKYYPNKENKAAHIEVKISDSGIGITYAKLQMMRNIGAISDTEDEKKYIQGMPEWLKPTGEFGIGMQSTFTVVDSFSAVTYPRYEKGKSENLKRTIRFFCTELGGDIVNFEGSRELCEINRYGTDVIVNIELNEDNILKMFEFNSLYSMIKKTSQFLDPTVIKGKLSEYVMKTFSNDIIGIDFEFRDFEDKPSSITYDFPLSSKINVNNECILYFSDDRTVYFWYNNINEKERNSVLFTLNEDLSNRWGNVKLYYRGIAINNDEVARELVNILLIPGIEIKINIMSGSAGKFLEINRDYIKKSGYNWILCMVRRGMKEFYRALYNTIQGTDKCQEKFARTFIQNNVIHFQIFIHLLSIFKADYKLIDADIRDIVSSFEDTLKGKIYVVFVEGNKVIFDYLPTKILKNIISFQESEPWFIYGGKKDYESNSLEIKNDHNRLTFALIDRISDLYDLQYEKMFAFKPKAWGTDYIKAYTLTTKNAHQKIDSDSYRIICNSIIDKYIKIYEDEKDSFKKKTAGDVVVSFPSIEQFADIEVDKIPVETPNDLAERYYKYIICPFKIRDISEWRKTRKKEEHQFYSKIVDDLEDNIFFNIIIEKLSHSNNKKEIIEKYHNFFNYL